MRKLLPLIAASLLAGGPVLARPVDREADLERATAGRIAGEPVDCINLHSVRGSRIIDGTAIVYDMGSVLYVNRPESGASQLNQHETMVTQLHSSRLCSTDTVTLVEPSTNVFRGTIFLGEFVPYRRIRTGSAD